MNVFILVSTGGRSYSCKWQIAHLYDKSIRWEECDRLAIQFQGRLNASKAIFSYLHCRTL